MRLSHRLYYFCKPLLPWQARMAVRRFVARRERAANTEVWPIKPSAAVKPADWNGWPDNKQFAVVLTHDVEGPGGLAQVKRLAELEMAMGFRSSFNFVPDGDYAVTASLRQWLTERGFEVGVHDLEHDGRLFQSKDGFTKKAARINRYLRDWDAAGFRAGFMLRNLEWQHQLAIEYDSSTFDTDPFELQSDGLDTIFPSWIARDGDGTTGVEPFAAVNGNAVAGHRGVRRTPTPPKGYVELPYTLPQDSTLYLVLGESSPDIWLRKTDWIAQNGGMVLVNVHPDYIDFTGDGDHARKYPVARYEEFLRHLSKGYSDRFWHVLPKDVARWFKTTRAGIDSTVPSFSSRYSDENPPLRGKRAAVLLYSEYPADPRPRRAAEAMLEAGMEVDILCVAGAPHEPESEVDGRLRIFRLPIKRSRDSKLGYFGKYARFLTASFWFLVRHGMLRKYDVIHVHNMPDVLVFSTLLSKLAGAKVILDLHDPMPEVMMTIYGLEENQLPVRVLKQMEKWSIGLADTVITVNEACRRLFSTRSCSIEKINVIMNSPDEGVFASADSAPRRPTNPSSGRRFVIMYHGSIVERHGLDIAVEALREFRTSAPNAELRIYGNETPFLRKVLDPLKGTDLEGAVRYLGPKTLEEIVVAIRECDIGVIPNRRSIFTELNTPTRIFEYLSQGKPVIAPRAPGILDYFGPSDLVYFELGSVEDLVAKFQFAFGHPEAVSEIVRKGQAVYYDHLWSNERHRFIDVVARTLGLPTGHSVPISTDALAATTVSK